MTVYALVIPADQRLPCDIRQIALTAGALSDTIGGARYTTYADADRLTKRLPGNPRATQLAAHLG